MCPEGDNVLLKYIEATVIFNFFWGYEHFLGAPPRLSWQRNWIMNCKAPLTSTLPLLRPRRNCQVVPF